MRGTVQERVSVHQGQHGAEPGMIRDEGDAATKYLKLEDPDFYCLPLGVMQPAQSECREYKPTAARVRAPWPTTKDCARDRARGESQLLLHYFTASEKRPVGVTDIYLFYLIFIHMRL